MKKEDTTASKQASKQIRMDILKLTHNMEQKRDKRIRRDNWIYGVTLSAVSLLGLLALASGNVISLLFCISTAMWVGLSWTKDGHIANLHHILDMTFGLRDLERREIATLMQKVEKK